MCVLWSIRPLYSARNEESVERCANKKMRDSLGSKVKSDIFRFRIDLEQTIRKREKISISPQVFAQLSKLTDR